MTLSGAFAPLPSVFLPGSCFVIKNCEGRSANRARVAAAVRVVGVNLAIPNAGDFFDEPTTKDDIVAAFDFFDALGGGVFFEELLRCHVLRIHLF